MRHEEMQPIMQSSAILLSLMAATFCMQLPRTILSLFMIDIAATFMIPIGVAGQLGTAAFVVTVITAALTGILTSQLSHKTLLILSICILCVAAIGCAFAPSFTVLLPVYALGGVNTGLAFTLVNSLIGRYYAVHERPQRISYIAVANMLPPLLAAPVFGVIGDWRLAFIIVAVVTGITSILLTKGLPPDEEVSGRSLEGYSKVLRTPSALGVILGNTFATVGYIVIAVFALSLFRAKFDVSAEFVSQLASTGMAIAWMSGNLLGGRLVPIIGRKTLTVVFALVIGLAVIGLAVLPHFWLALTSFYIGSFCAGIRSTAVIALALEQVPEFRAVMQATFTVSQYAASTIGTALGGMILVLLNYDWLAILGVFTIVGGMIFQLTTVDPTKQEKSHQL